MACLGMLHPHLSPVIMRRADQEDYIVFRFIGGVDPVPGPLELPAGLAATYWEPGLTDVIPPGQDRAFAVWWALHQAHVLRGREFAVQLISDGPRVVHRSCVVPPWFRWPFMSVGDVQISDTWTDPEYRGRGLARWAATQILRRHRNRTVWYATQEWNSASIGVCLGAGMKPHGRAMRTKRLGIRFLGTLEPIDRLQGVV